MAEDLARFVSQMRAIPVPAAPLDDPALSWYRGGPLAALDGDFREAVDACRANVGLDLDLRRAALMWEAALAAESVGAKPRSAPRPSTAVAAQTALPSTTPEATHPALRRAPVIAV
jgi:hypothetical protein